MGILRADRITGLGGANAIKGSVEMRGAQNMRAEIVNDNADFNLGSSNFTAECWYNPGGTTGTDNSLDVDLLMLWNNSTNRRSYGLYRDSGGYLGFIGSSDGTNSDMNSYHSYNFPDVNAWYHIAAVRISNTVTVYVNGTSIGSATVSGSYYENTVDNLVIGGQLSGTSYDSKIARGFISNMRLIIGDGIYTGAFTPPTNELTVTPNTKLLCCQSSGNILQEATGKTLIAYRSTVNDSFAKASTFTPNTPVGFSTTTDVGSQYGSTFDGFGSFTTSTYMVPPGGNTRERNRGRGLHAGGENPSHCNIIDFIQIQSGGTAQDFGDLITLCNSCDGVASKTRAVFATFDSPNLNLMEFVTIASTGNGTSFGEQTVSTGQEGSTNNDTIGLFAGGYQLSYFNHIEKITIATAGNAVDFGDLLNPTVGLGGAADTTRGVFAGGITPGVTYTNVIQKVEFATTANAVDFGDLTVARRNPAGTSDSTRGIFAGGNTNSPTNMGLNTIDFITIQSLGNAVDFGDMPRVQSDASGTSDSIRGVFSAGYYGSPNLSNVIEMVMIQTTGNAVDYGDLIDERIQGGSVSDSHGGLS